MKSIYKRHLTAEIVEKCQRKTNFGISAKSKVNLECLNNDLKRQVKSQANLHQYLSITISNEIVMSLNKVYYIK